MGGLSAADFCVVVCMRMILCGSIQFPKAFRFAPAHVDPNFRQIET